VTAVPRVRSLSIHADYGCGRTGACCSSGWEIPVEPEAEERIRAGLRPGETAAFRPLAFLPHGARVVLRTDATGRCVFLEGGRGPHGCAVHRQVGEEALPSACRQFPRVATLTPLGVSVALSHYCPTAAGALFRDDLPLAVVDGPPAFPAAWPWEGLDAREALPPLLRPGVLMDWPGLERWERFCVSVLAEEGRDVEDALGILERAAEEARRWTPEQGAFGGWFEGVLEGVGRGRARPGVLRNGSGYSRVKGAVPHRARRPAAPEGLGEADDRWVAAGWPARARPIRRWLAAKAFASWVTLQGDGLRTTILSLRVALDVLRVEAGRGCTAAARPLDEEVLKEAIRRADLLLVHLADPEALARRLSRCESADGPAVAW